MLDQIFTLQTLAGTVSGAAMMLICTTVAQRVPARWLDRVRSSEAAPPAVEASKVHQAAAIAAVPDLLQPAVKADPAPIVPASAPPIVRAHYADGLNRKTRVAPVKAARVLIDFMQAHGASGYFTPGEINEWWRWACAELNLDTLHPDVVRAELASLPNVWKPNTRLNAPEYRAVKARTGKERSILYRIPAARAEAGGVAGAGRDSWAETGKATGQRPANAKKASKSGMLSGSQLYQEAA